MVINPSVPAKTVPEFIAYAKANPGKINMGSSGSGSASHVFGERFKMMTGINLVHVPYRGGYVPDLLGGQVQVVFGTISSCIQYIRGVPPYRLDWIVQGYAGSARWHLWG